MFDGKIIDLSQEIYQGMAVYPGHLKGRSSGPICPTRKARQRQLGTGFSYGTRGIMFCDHGQPTSIPSATCRGIPTAGRQDPAGDDHTSAICLDVSDIPQKTQFGRAKIENSGWNLDIRKGDTILFHMTPSTTGITERPVHDRLPGTNRTGKDGIHHRPGDREFRRRFLEPRHVVRQDVPLPFGLRGEEGHAHREPVQPGQGGGQTVHLHRPSPQRSGSGHGSPLRAVAILPE